ncbi:alpha-hydroxy-acid oxidizing protein [Alloalcanivorax xenomutans]|uniref:alpha-hydroxy-acid oxidizing protein n=1 Tax=Alloalcanivorax xenomutans TaxID=1094342 RepID=UPI003C37C7B1
MKGLSNSGGVLLGRPFVYALAAAGEQGVAHVPDLIASEMKVAMTLTGARAVGAISRESLVKRSTNPVIPLPSAADPY